MKQPLKRVAVAIFAGAGGLLVNYLVIRWAFPFTVGRIVTLPIAILFGPWLGALSSLIACSLYFTTGPFVAGVSVRAALLALEALVIGVFSRRKRSQIMVAGAFFLDRDRRHVRRPSRLARCGTHDTRVTTGVSVVAQRRPRCGSGQARGGHDLAAPALAGSPCWSTAAPPRLRLRNLCACGRRPGASPQRRDQSAVVERVRKPKGAPGSNSLPKRRVIT